MPKTPSLRELRNRAALSQEELAERAGVSRATIADLEAGNRGAWPQTIRKLAETLHVEPEDLFAEPDLPKAEAPPSQRTLFSGLAEERRAASFRRATRNLEELVEPFEAKLGGPAGALTEEDRARLDKAAALMTPLLQVALEAEASFLREQYPDEYDVGPYAVLGPAIVRFVALVAEVGGETDERVRELEELHGTAYTAAA